MKLYVDPFIKIVGPNFGTNYRRNQTELGRPYGFCLMTGSISRPLKIVNPVALAALSMAISSLVRGTNLITVAWFLGERTQGYKNHQSL